MLHPAVDRESKLYSIVLGLFDPESSRVLVQWRRDQARLPIPSRSDTESNCKPNALAESGTEDRCQVPVLVQLQARVLA